MNPNRPAQASDQNLNGDMVFGLACASLVAVVLLVYALVFYDGRGKTRRIVDCLRHAGYTATVSRQPYIVEYDPNASGPTLFDDWPPPPDTVIKAYTAPGDSPFHGVQITIYQGRIDRWDISHAPGRDQVAILNCADKYVQVS